jgi:hypothetical protein
MWEDHRLRDITEADVRQIIAAQLEEHLQLEYKSALYPDNERGHKEFLQDICMFANSGGGILLLGISERRDEGGQPTGLPDPDAQLGLDVPNPEAVLQAYDARVVASIEERLPLESYPIPVANAENRYILAMRVPNSMSKPHRVQYQGRTYFPSRRERHRYEMDVREIKETVMRTASRLEEAEAKLSDALRSVQPPDLVCSLVVGVIPIFWRNFMIDVQNEQVIQSVSQFHLGHRNFREVTYNFNGLERKIVASDDSVVQVHRDGMVVLHRRLGLNRVEGRDALAPTGIDIVLRAFVQRSAEVFTAATISGPFLLTMLLKTANETLSAYPMAGMPQAVEFAGTIPAGNYLFPAMQTESLIEVDKMIRPLCDQAHQMFGRDSSPCFNADGAWNRRY